MATTIGVQELKANLSRVLRQVRETGEVFEVTHRGRVFARIVPVAPASDSASTVAMWSDIDQLAAEIGRAWHPRSQTAAATVSEGRRG